jgi:hypothetical protein
LCMGLVDNHTLEVHPLKHQEGTGKILPSVQLKMAQFARFGTMPETVPFCATLCHIRAASRYGLYQPVWEWDPKSFVGVEIRDGCQGFKKHEFGSPLS